MEISSAIVLMFITWFCTRLYCEAVDKKGALLLIGVITVPALVVLAVNALEGA